MSFQLPASALDVYDGRFEFWDGRTETAWKVREPTSIWHEQPTRRADGGADLRGGLGALERVARAMGGREGTSPEDDPIMRSVSRRAEAKGRADAMVDAVLATLRLRGIDVPAGLADAVRRTADLALDAVLVVALACGDADFRRRLREAAPAVQ